MEQVLDILKQIHDSVPLVIQLLTAIIAIALVIPGEQPEKFLHSVVDLLKKISKK
jgi:hypothetical protein